MKCPHCGRDNPFEAAFCGECGIPLSSGAGTIGGTPTGPPTVPATGATPPATYGMVSDATGSEPTRYLCAAVQMNDRLAHLLVDAILLQEHRAVASSPDVDLVTVFKHAISANTRRMLRDTALFVILALLVVLAFTGHLVKGLVACFLLALAVVVTETLITRHEVLAGLLGRYRFRPTDAPEPPPHWAPALRRIAEQGSGNVSVYSGFSPFVGYGSVLDSWSFALDVTRPSDGCDQTRAFGVDEIHDHVAARVTELALPGLEVADRLFVNGQDIRGDQRFLPDPMRRPVFAVDGSLVRQLLAAPEDRARPYLMMRVVGWKGELALSVFCRFLLIESYLFVEASFSLLTPIDEAYRAVDAMLPTPTVGEVSRTVLDSVVPTLRLTVTSVQKVAAALYSPLAELLRRFRERRSIERNPMFDYGALLSVREAASDRRHQRYFQQLDSELYRKVVERRILDALVEFLDEHDIATDDLVERQTTILNQGVMVSGHGTLSAQNVAVGTGARAGTGDAAKPDRSVQRIAGHTAKR